MDKQDLFYHRDLRHGVGQLRWTACRPFVAEDYAEAVDAWRPLATAGHAKAQNNIAYMYSRGLGVEQDLKQSFAWYTRAAEQDYAIAQYNLGLMYAKGKGVALDNKAGTDWMHRAAMNGHNRAQVRLAERISEGIGVGTDLSRSYAWLVIAGANAAGKQAKMVEALAARLGSKMSSIELARAHTISKQLNEAISDGGANGLLPAQLVTE